MLQNHRLLSTSQAYSEHVLLCPQVLSDVRGIIAEQLGKELDAVQQDSKFADLGADSLDTVEIMMALEEKFGFEVCPTQLAHVLALGGSGMSSGLPLPAILTKVISRHTCSHWPGKIWPHARMGI